MGRRKITKEAEQQAEQEAQESDESDDSEREQLTQRMPTNLVDDVDEIADHLGMSRNATVNMLCRRCVSDMREELGLE